MKFRGGVIALVPWSETVLLETMAQYLPTRLPILLSISRSLGVLKMHRVLLFEQKSPLTRL